MESTDTQCETKFPVSVDPVSQLALVDKYVKVELIKNTEFFGFIHSIDPLTQSIILSVSKEDNFQVVLIPGHAVLNIYEEAQPLNSNPPVRKHDTIDNVNVIARKATLLAWFKFNRLPVTESGDNLIFGNVSILPPYNAADVCTDNPIIALQVKSLIENLPEDFRS